MDESNSPSLNLDTNSLPIPTRGRRRPQESSSSPPLSPAPSTPCQRPRTHTYASHFLATLTIAPPLMTFLTFVHYRTLYQQFLFFIIPRCHQQTREQTNYRQRRETGANLFKGNRQIVPCRYAHKKPSAARIDHSLCDDLKLARQEKAAILIQRVARGVEARGSVLKRRSSEIARDTFEKSLDLHLSPAENASKALLALAAVIILKMDTYIYRFWSRHLQRLRLSDYDTSVIKYAISVLQVHNIIDILILRACKLHSPVSAWTSCCQSPHRPWARKVWRRLCGQVDPRGVHGTRPGWFDSRATNVAWNWIVKNIE